MKKILLGFASVLMLWSCKTIPTAKPTATENNTATIPKGNKAFFSQISKKTDFQQVKINSKINVETGNFLPTLDAVIYIERDQKIWLNASALFLNVARAVATPEGIKAHEKWNKTYIESDFAYLNNLLNVNFIQYDALQSLLIGKTFVPINETDFTLENTANGYTLTSKKPQKISVDGKSVQYQMQLHYAPNTDLSKVSIQEVAGAKNQLEVYYENWQDFGTAKFPKNVKIIIKGEKNGQILIENTKFDFHKMETPYSVPSNYKKIQIK